MAADTSSSAAASTPVVWVAAAALAELIVEPRLAKSEAAAVTNPGAAITNDISVLSPRHQPPGRPTVSREPERLQGTLRKVASRAGQSRCDDRIASPQVLGSADQDDQPR